jgi:hypothetical protein
MLQCWVERKRIIEILWFNDRTIRREIDRWAVGWIYYPKVWQEYVDKGIMEEQD